MHDCSYFDLQSSPSLCRPTTTVLSMAQPPQQDFPHGNYGTGDPNIRAHPRLRSSIHFAQQFTSNLGPY